MNERQNTVLKMCDSAIASLCSADNRTFSQDMTERLVVELTKMKEALDPEIFAPSYGRYIIDSYDGELVDQLINVSYEYSRIRKQGKLRGGAPRA